MKDYRLFTAADFVQDEDFIRWNRDKKPTDQSFWEEWLRLNPDKRSQLEEARQILASIDIRHKPVSDEQVNAEIDRLLLNIGATGAVTPAGSPINKRRRLFTRSLAIAASLLLIIIALQHIYHPIAPKATRYDYAVLTTTHHLVEKINTSGRTDTLFLADGSQIQLAPKSRISYSAGIDTAREREIYLSGEAFFLVTKNPRHPLQVITGEVVTKVLGTSFYVRSYEGDTTIQVTVRSGKVSVYSQAIPGAKRNIVPQTDSAAKDNIPVSAAPGGIILYCNQRLIYEKTARKFQKLLLDQPAIVSADLTDENMIYEDTPLENVFAQLGHVYGIHVIYDNELLKKCTVTADLKGETFYHKLDLICRAIGATYEVIDGQVVIQSAGCQ